jgi:hypothetical protein
MALWWGGNGTEVGWVVRRARRVRGMRDGCWGCASGARDTGPSLGRRACGAAEEGVTERRWQGADGGIDSPEERAQALKGHS